MLDKKNFYINGQWVKPNSSEEIKVIDPATEDNCAVITLGNKADVDMAVNAAKDAYQSWAFSSKEERIGLLEKLYENYKKRWADIAEAMNQVCLKVMPAIASGCTMVLKPSELAPLSSIILAEIIDEVKFPKGVFNLFNGDGATTGDALTSHKDINMISFTGSTRAGALISQNAAKDFKRVSLELGGKGANIIFKDADPEAIERGALRCFRNSGQSCNAPTRMLVEKSMYNEAIERLKKYTESFEVGDPKKEGEHIGPVISEAQYSKIQTLIQKGIDEGAKLVAGGTGKPEGLDKGYFVKPTVFADVNNDMEVARTEIFGPVLSVIPFETEEDAIRIANDTAYGLTNYIQTQDTEKVQRVARKLRSGMVDVNGAGIAVDAPFGGFKHSGIGREAGAHGLEEFLEVKAVGGWS